MTIDKFGTVKILTVSRKQWHKNFENPSKFIFIVHGTPYFALSRALALAVARARLTACETSAPAVARKHMVR